ncbi:spliceosome-associated protein CWC27 homolog [Rhynchocyon petersi]
MSLVLLKTTAGDIDIELWSKEAPKACRNFIQLCLEAYYDNTIFHRVVPGFIVQGGDPTGTGTGGDSIYGAPFKDEFHSRLRFNRRGLVAMANAGPHDNGSQFFFTLGRADELNNKHTIFGKVTGDTVYNMLRLTEVDIDEDERPRNPHKIKNCEVLFNPFDDIIPREIKKPKKEKPEDEVKKLKPKGTKNFSLLSFGEEAEEEEEEVNRVSQSMKGKSKSSHDLLKDDPHLSSVPAVESEKDAAEDSDNDEDESAEHHDYSDDDEKNLMRQRIAKKLKKDTSGNVKSAGEGEMEKKSVSRSEELRKEARQLKRELLAAKQKKVESKAKQADKRSDVSGSVYHASLLLCSTPRETFGSAPLRSMVQATGHHWRSRASRPTPPDATGGAEQQETNKEEKKEAAIVTWEGKSRREACFFLRACMDNQAFGP